MKNHWRACSRQNSFQVSSKLNLWLFIKTDKQDDVKHEIPNAFLILSLSFKRDTFG